MAEWRIVRGWSDGELAERLRVAAGLERNVRRSHADRMAAPDFETHGSRGQVGREAPGPPEPGSLFRRARRVLESYAFSDPGLVEAHFDPDRELLGRRMLLEVKVLLLRYLCPVVVTAVRDEADGERTTWGFRYDTLEGHLEAGSEWFLLDKDHGTGVVTFTIEASWQPGDFPNWWSRAGFALLAERYQRRWHEAAHRRMGALVRGRRERTEETEGRRDRGSDAQRSGELPGKRPGEITFTGTMKR